MVSKVLFSSAKEEWATPQDFFDRLDNYFHFQLDAAADNTNNKCKTFFTKEEDALQQSWCPGPVWLNPPYGRDIGKWVCKALYESCKHGTPVVCLLPARTDTRWFHEFCKPPKARVIFLKGRLKFGGCKDSAPFPSMLVIYDDKTVMPQGTYYDLESYLEDRK